MQWPYLFLLIASCSFMLVQAVQTGKETKHYLFAFFCGSMVMTSLQHLSAPSLGAYQYLFGIGACATCNAVWLISRALFRTKHAIKLEHIAVAGVIAILIMLNKTNALLSGLEIQAYYLQLLKDGMNEVLNLLSSTILVLSVWEAMRGYKHKPSAKQRQRAIFIGAFCFGLFTCMVLPTFISDQNTAVMLMPYFVAVSAFVIMLAIQVILHLQKVESIREIQGNHITLTSLECTQETEGSPQSIDMAVVSAIERLISTERIYLQPNLKMADIAQKLNIPEYKVSRVVRYHFNAPNFNYFINAYRIEHAKQLIASESAKNWSMLVISLESGFSSVVTFNRAFKAKAGFLPSEYKKQVTV